MKHTPLDQAARDAAQTSLGETTFIAAGAGTGKTTTIVMRIVNAICEPTTEHTIQKLVAITFTERAAAELKSRIRSEFEARAASGQREAVAALADFESAQIGTIHAFAKRILSSFPIEAGLPITFQVSDEASSKLRIREAASRFTEKFFSALSESDKNLLHAGAITPLVFREFFIELNGKRLLVNQNDLLSGRQLDTGAFIEEFMTRLGDWYDSQESLWSTFTPSLAPKIEEALSSLNAVFADGKTFSADKIKNMQGILHTLMRPGNAGGSQATSFKDEARLNFEGGLTGLEFIPVENLIRQSLPSIWSALENEVSLRYGLGNLTFDDLVVLAVQLIERNDDVRSRLQENFNLVVIDEFQDTDPLQWRLAQLITTRLGSQGATPGSLVLVGDAQQSIYSFRGADVSTYLGVQDLIEGPPFNGRQHTLQVNFRSNQKILNWTNAAFSHSTVELGAKYTELVAAESNSVGDDHVPGVTVIGGPDNEMGHDQEVGLIASAAFKAVENSWPVFDGVKEEGMSKKYRAAKYSDIVILIPARTSLENLMEELSSREIPYRSSDSAIVYDRPVVRGLLDSLKAVAGVAEPLDIWFALKSPLFGCDDFELLTYKQMGGTWNLPFGDASPDISSTRVFTCLSVLAQIRKVSGSLKPAAALQRIADESRITSTYDQTPRGRFELECVQMIIRQARTWSNAGGLGVMDYLDWITDQLGESTREALPETDDLKDDAVRISTVHGVKGLEFPIVIVAGMANQRMTKLPMISVKGNRFEFKFGSASSVGYRQISEALETSERRAEQTRVLYVAATRARDHLVFSNIAKVSNDGSTPSWSGIAREAVADTVRAGLASKFDQFVSPSDSPVLTIKPDFAPEAEAWIRAIEAVRTASQKKTLVTPSALRGESGEVTEGDEEAALIEELQEQSVDYVDDEIAGSDVAKLGNAFHSTMDFIIQTRSLEIDEALVLKMNAALAEYRVKEHNERLTKMIKTVLQSEILRRIYSADRVWAELQMAEIDADGMLVEGFADLVIQEGDLLTVLDYKTNLQLDSLKMAKYARQLQAYSQIIESATNLKVEEKLVVHVLPDKIETLSV